MDLNLFLIGSFLLEKMVERAQSVKNTKILALVLLSSNTVLIIVFLLAEANIGHVWILLGFHQPQQSPRKARSKIPIVAGRQILVDGMCLAAQVLVLPENSH